MNSGAYGEDRATTAHFAQKLRESRERMEPKPEDAVLEPVRTGFAWPRLVLILGLLLACYPLSIGPAWKLQENGTISWQAYSRIYGPLHAISRTSPILMNIVDWYVIKLWHGHYHFIYY